MHVQCVPMQRESLLPLVTRLGQAFAARGMGAHARMLRVYFLALRHGLADSRNAVRVSLNEEAVLQWLRTLRVPPFDSEAEGGYHVQQRGEGCGTCAALGETPTVITDAVFPGGARMRCRSCGSLWLEEDAPAQNAKGPHGVP